MKAETLITMLGGQLVGQVTRRGDKLSFDYAEAWRTSPHAIPLSLSLPLAMGSHAHKPTEAYLWGLLPDNEYILERWAKRFHVSARSPFALLAHVGQDCAGAVQFFRDEESSDEAFGQSQPGKVQWLREADVAKRLATLVSDASAWRADRDTGQFSLAGAQPKIALLHLGKRWGVPSGPIPTTHILKPPLGLDGMAENEHLCLRLARHLGFPAASSEVLHFEDQVTIAVERYDRIITPPKGRSPRPRDILRLHQEDLCQALAVLPTRKYENEGGPGAAPIATLLRTASSRPPEDLDTFVDALAFNWLIAGSDAHAKNFSLMHGPGGQTRLAPLYDIASALPYSGPELRKVRLAMKIGGKYPIRDIGGPQWRKLATDLSLKPTNVLERVADLATRLPACAQEVCSATRQTRIAHPIVDQMETLLCQRAKHCLNSLS